MHTEVGDEGTVEMKSPQQRERPRVKRTRVTLACERCRARKQKCNGAQDACSTCTRLGLRCQYKAHVTPRPDQKRLYITALEDRVAELESFLSTLGHDSVGDDHWREKQHRFEPDLQPQEDQQSEEIDVIAGDMTEPSSDKVANSDNGNSSMPIGRVFSSVIKTQKSPKSDLDRDEEPSRSVPRSELVETMGKMFVSPTVASRLLDGWIKHLSTQYPVIHTPRLKELHARRDGSLDIFEESILHLIYANSGRILEAVGDTGMFYADQHYEAALQNMDAILELRDTRSVTYLLLLALYCLRGPKDPGAWTLAGLAVRLCIELGLHRKSLASTLTLERELEVRIFWSCYFLDRGISVALGRPPAISDSDIDVEFPIDIDEDVDDLEALQRAAKSGAGFPLSSPTSLTPFIHFMRLRRIESKVEHTIYRVNRHIQTAPTVIQGFLDQLTSWKQAIPPEYYNQVDAKCEPYNGIDFFMIPYYKCVRLLLYPQLSKRSLNLQYLKICADACAGICEAYKRLHRIGRADCSPLAIQSLFLAGLTLTYCTWLAPRNYVDVMGAISDCNLMLYVMAERCPPARKYRDVFERIKVNVIDVIAQGNHQVTRAAGILDAEMTERCRALDQGLPDTVRTDYSKIISDLAKDKRRTGSETRTDSSGARLKGNAGQYGHAPQFNMSPGPMIDYGIGHPQGNFIDSAFMFNLEDISGLTTDWDT